MNAKKVTFSHVDKNMTMSPAEHVSLRKLYLNKAQLKQSSQVSALLSGFALVAMVEMDIDKDGDDKVPFTLLLFFILCTTLLVSVHILALMISTCILPHVDATVALRDAEHGQGLTQVSPHERMKLYIAIAWCFSTVFGIFLFIFELGLIIWVKFWYIDTRWIAVASSIILIPVVCIFVFFSSHLYRQLVTQKFERSKKVLHELEEMAEQITLHDSVMTINKVHKNGKAIIYDDDD